MTLSLYHVSKFQKLSFGSRQLCPKIVLRPQTCKAGALELLRSLWSSALLAPTTEHLGSIAGHFEGFGEKLIQEDRSGLGSVGEFFTGLSAC